MASLSRVVTGLIRLTVKAFPNVDAKLLASAREELSKAQAIETAVHALKEFVNRSGAPVNPEDISRARVEWERGEGMEAAALLAQREDRRPA
jgi:hypothetical protein